MKSKLKLAPKINTKHTLIYTATGVVAVLLVGIGAFFFLNFGSSSETKAETAAEPPIVRSRTSGNWNDNV